MKLKQLLTPLLLLYLFSCTPDNARPVDALMNAYIPVYASTTDVTQISVEAPKPTTEAGKIYAYGNYIFQNDLNTGIHIIDNSDNLKPKKVSFLKLPLSTEIAVKGNYLYANNFRDIVVFDISNPAQPRLVKRVSNVFPPANQQYPPFSNVYFECPDASKGVIVRWEMKTIKTPKCRR
jgi:hypothetical protein